MNEREMVQRLAVSTAIEKHFKAINNPRNHESLRAQVDRSMKEDYFRTGNKARDIEINGKKVGTISIAFTAEKTGFEPVVRDYDEFAGWFAKPENFAYLRHLVDVNLKSAVEVSTSEGEVPDGVEYRQVAEPRMYKGTTLRGCKPEQITEALGPRLTETVAGLLYDGEGEK